MKWTLLKDILKTRRRKKRVASTSSSIWTTRTRRTALLLSSSSSSLVLSNLLLFLCGLLFLTVIPVDSRGTCRIGEFRCESGECITKDRVCDSIRDCPSGIDEYVCTPKFRRGLCGYHRMRFGGADVGNVGQNVISSFMKNSGGGGPSSSPSSGTGGGGGTNGAGIFQCQFGGCIPLNRLCDGNVNCIGGSDESEICENNSCLPGYFRCKYGACIPDWQMCNGRVNCPDGSDETPEACKHITCAPNEFRCRYGGCIPKDKICDIKKNCADGSDEYDFLCLITRAKMVEKWGLEGKQLNEEQEASFFQQLEKQKQQQLQEQEDQRHHTPPATEGHQPDTTIPSSSTPSEESSTPEPVTETTTITTEELPIPTSTSVSSSVSSVVDSPMRTSMSTSMTISSSKDGIIVKDQDVVATSTTTTTTTTEAPSPPPIVECLLPDIPENVDASITTCATDPDAYFCQDSSQSVPVGVIIHYECGPGFLLYGPQAITCTGDGTWSARPPECDPLIDVRFGFGSALPNNFDPRCPPLHPPKGVRVECIDPSNIALKSCGEKQEPGTEARFSCSPYYKPSNDLKPSHYEKCGEDGSWTPGTVEEQFSCVPDCGLSEAPKTPYIWNGASTKRGQWPWHVAIYLKAKDGGEATYICGGALISENAVLTSAHCVTVRGEAREPSSLQVYLGKQNLGLPDKDPFVQRRSVGKIFVEDSFNHRALDSDIAVLALGTPAISTFYVRPVCYPQSSNSFLEEYQLSPGSLGTVVGFGFTENGTLAQDLRMAALPVVSPGECAASAGDFFASMTRSTNYCAGFKNGTQVCNGDSGGGQYFRASVRGTTRWYVQGLVSYGVPDSKPGSCASSQYAIFTRVGRYGDWLLRTMSRENLI